MIVLSDDTQIRIWWGQCPPTKRRDLPFERHRRSESERGKQAPLAYGCRGRNIRDDLYTDLVASGEPEDYLESDGADGLNGAQPESSAIAATRETPLEPQTSRTRQTYSTAHTSRPAKASTRAQQPPRDSKQESSATAAEKGDPQEPESLHTLRTSSTAITSPTAKARTGTLRRARTRGGLVEANDTEPDLPESDFAEIFFHNLSVELVPDSEVISDIPLGKPRSALLPEAPVRRSGRQIPGLAREQADRKKAPSSRPINSSRKRDGAGTTGGVNPKRPAHIHQPPRKRVRRHETPPKGPNTNQDAEIQPARVQESVSDASS